MNRSPLMRLVSTILLLLIAAPFLHADAGLPNFGPRPLPANHQATFEGLERYSDYIFFVVPGPGAVASGRAPAKIYADTQLIAVPKAVAQGATTWNPTWESASASGVVKSGRILDGVRRIPAYSPATVTIHFRIDLTGDD